MLVKSCGGVFMRRGKCGCRFGLYFSAFGVGMIVAMICPKSFIVAVLSVAVIVLGLIISK